MKKDKVLVGINRYRRNNTNIYNIYGLSSNLKAFILYCDLMGVNYLEKYVGTATWEIPLDAKESWLNYHINNGCIAIDSKFLPLVEQFNSLWREDGH